MITLYNVVSADGYIARKDGSEDFIPDSCWPHTLNILKEYDCIIMGRKSYDSVQNYSDDLKKSFENLPVRKIVITRNKNFHVKNGYEIIHNFEEIADSNLNMVITSGPSLNNYLLHKKLVDKIIYTEVSELIGDGIKPYDNFNGVANIIKIPIVEISCD
jgi:dihydrofolate reductase